jgi:hypothetical protein
MKVGIIRLMNPSDDNIVVQRLYTGKSHRNKIIERWKRMYGKNINELCIDICPDTEPFNKKRRVNGNKRMDWRKGQKMI